MNDTRLHDHLHQATSSALRRFGYLSYDDKQDLYQEGYLGAWQAVPKFRAEPKHFIGYLYYRAYFAMIGYLRTQGQLLASQDNKRKAPRPVLESIDTYSIGQADPAFAAIENKLVVRWLCRDMPNRRLRYVLCAILQDRSNAEMAEKIGRHKDTVSKYKNTVKAWLKQPRFCDALTDWKESASGIEKRYVQKTEQEE